ncbi:glycosyltransferase family 4 protein [Chloroflexota bacterium]
MKIAILIERMFPGALPKVVGAQSSYLTKLGHEVEVLVIMQGGLPHGNYQFDDFLDGVTIRELSREVPLARLSAFRFPFFNFFSVYHLAGPFYVPRVIKNGEYDIVIALGALTSLTAWALRRRRRIPYLTFHWDPLSKIIPKVYSGRLPGFLYWCLLRVGIWLDRFVVRNSLVTLTTSEVNASALRPSGVPGAVEIVPMGCYPLDKLPDRRGDYLLTLERWDNGNMPHMLLEVLGKLSKPVELKVAGFWSDESLRDSFMKLLASSGLSDRVEVLGPVSESHLKELFLHARAWLHPKAEPSLITMPMLEAATCGCPIVIPREKREGSSDFLHGTSAFFPLSGDIDEYTDCVDKLVTDERLAYEIGRAGWEVARQYSWENHVTRIENIIRERL